MSKKRKGLSLEEKRQRILGIYHSSGEVYNLKEIEKIASKAGVVLQTIKDVNQSLIDDHLVDADKIGSANFFWSFPSKVYVVKKTKIESLQKQIEDSKRQLNAAQDKVADLENAGRQDSNTRREGLAKLDQERKRGSELDERLQCLKENDPEELLRLKNLQEEIKEHVNRWTDNIWAVKSWCVKKKGMPSKDVDRYMQLPQDFDYIS
uniref:Meiotic nuclear division protein 1 homolog n=1 Tax=Fibrocapsa japonica TaxID=94617 RepID=A0A7S2XYC3_9STRA|mmetsp:Transcript_21625/g.31369  ORF Transcript_21625/g.31369 Transcript_21625/m.31369 type:complete len:207 (+) Transcript_21625:137-757(+)|eukprot:CAMPEP_0113937016 /NCGR_PEP_ID=MMETSP1339-20121228/3732_1 /TAXON_ID=94617 /ORGANISM="Fibrocapsa japonica" /LENGTH=206 /DNA_ID=CAMNT_0000939623 /DNA_START=74 /DNA_END=694 /DNA_ORIENTATION=- /assembly_acc=CAM_ASM_000762